MKEPIPIPDILQSSVWASSMMYISNITLKWLSCALLCFTFICTTPDLYASVSESATSAAWSDGRHHDGPIDPI